MPSICLYFQVHQPYRLKRYTYLNVGRNVGYFDDRLNAQIAKKVSNACYIPTNQLLLSLIERYGGAFKIAFSMSGTVVEQLAEHAPEALETFRELAATGAVEFLAETYNHSLAYLFDEREFRAQVAEHAAMVKREFGQRPRVIRNTELIYDDAFGSLATAMGYAGVVAEGVDDVLGWRSPNFVYRVPGQDTRILLRNYRLSDDIAFRFSRRDWPGAPVTAKKFAGWAHEITGHGDVLGLFMDYETFGEHQHESTGIFTFLEQLPGEMLDNFEWSFATPSEVIQSNPTPDELSFGRTTSWADIARDVSAWNGTRMQASALRHTYDLAARLADLDGGEKETLLREWRKLQTSDHFYYMSTKIAGDGVVHSYFSPFESPYDAFIAYMNVLRDFNERVARAEEAKVLPIAV